MVTGVSVVLPANIGFRVQVLGIRVWDLLSMMMGPSSRYIYIFQEYIRIHTYIYTQKYTCILYMSMRSDGQLHIVPSKRCDNGFAVHDDGFRTHVFHMFLDILYGRCCEPLAKG